MEAHWNYAFSNRKSESKINDVTRTQQSCHHKK